MTNPARPQWRKATASDTAQGCVEVAHLDDGTVGLRDSKDRSLPAFTYTAEEWHDFLTGALDGSHPTVQHQPNGIVTLRPPHGSPGHHFTFTPHEWACFLDGIRKQEFDLAPARIAG